MPLYGAQRAFAIKWCYEHGCSAGLGVHATDGCLAILERGANNLVFHLAWRPKLFDTVNRALTILWSRQAVAEDTYHRPIGRSTREPLILP
jgi:hypothetical protein